MGESSRWRRSLETLSNLFDHNKEELLRKVKSYPADLEYNTAIASAAGLAAYGGAQVGGLLGADTETAEQVGTSSVAKQSNYAELEKANREKTKRLLLKQKQSPNRLKLLLSFNKSRPSPLGSKVAGKVLAMKVSNRLLLNLLS